MARYLDEIKEEARKAVGVSRPNPPVGAIIARDGVVIGRGHTQKVGSAHAEIMALRDAGEKARGAELYVSLEPCCHFGLTPPCTSAIIDAGISFVCYAHGDVNPVVRGKSRKILEDAGIRVVCLEEEFPAEARRFNDFYRAYDYFVRNRKTFVELKIAMTSDGFIAGEDRSRMKITDSSADADVQALRASADAILVSGATLDADDPLLTTRGVPGGNSPQRIVFSSRRILSPDRQIFHSGLRPIVYSEVAQPGLKGLADVRTLPGDSFTENWQTVLDALSREGMHRLLVEPGAALAESVLQTKLWNRLDLWVAPWAAGNGFPGSLSVRNLLKAGEKATKEQFKGWGNFDND